MRIFECICSETKLKLTSGSLCIDLRLYAYVSIRMCMPIRICMVRPQLDNLYNTMTSIENTCGHAVAIHIFTYTL